MDQLELQNLKRWFSEYCRSFYSSDPAYQKNITIKEKHTRHVCENMLEIARDLSLEEGPRALAEVIALFHDVGRFPQYQQYRTFRDDKSTNHAALGAGVLIRSNVLKNLPEREQKIVIRAVTLHNVFTIPEKLETEDLLYLKMIRDADKLDIWRVFIDYYQQHDEDRANAVGLGLPDTAEYSTEVIGSVLRRELVHLSMLKTLNDFKLLQLAWTFDLHFIRSLQLVRERSYIDKIAATLPQTNEIAEAVNAVRVYVNEKLRAG